MMDLGPPFRKARTEDADVLARLVNAAGEGLPLHLWTQMAKPGEDPWDIGRARQAARAEAGDIVVVDTGDGAIAGLTGYGIGPDPEQPQDETPPLFRPLVALEAKAPNTWYVNVLATLPELRGQGIGQSLLELAERIARAQGFDATSLIVGGQNVGAHRLYLRNGYRLRESLPVVTDGWTTRLETWVLMTKTLDA